MTPHEILTRGMEQLAIPGAKERAEKMLLFSDLLLQANQKMNLTAITDENEVAVKHFLDSLSLSLAADFSGKSVIDVGCGAGFPGLPLKIAFASIKLTMVDSLGKRLEFLREACQTLSIKGVEIIHARAEELSRDPAHRAKYDVAVSRAVARLRELCELCLPFVKEGGLFLAMKGPACDDELKESERAVKTLGAAFKETIDYPLFDSGVTHRIIVFQKMGPTPDKYPRRFAKITADPL